MPRGADAKGARPVKVSPHQVNIVVNDMGAMVAFYERLGVELAGGRPEWDPHHRSGHVEGGVDFDLDSPEFAAVWNR